jgi:hypothetical protein
MQKLNDLVNDENDGEVMKRKEIQMEKQTNFEKRVENVAVIFMYTIMDELESYIIH